MPKLTMYYHFYGLVQTEEGTKHTDGIVESDFEVYTQEDYVAFKLLIAAKLGISIDPKKITIISLNPLGRKV